MTLNAVSPNERMEMYMEYNSPTTNAGVEYITNPNNPTKITESDKTISYLTALGAPKNEMLAPILTPEKPKADLSAPVDKIPGIEEDPLNITKILNKKNDGIKPPYAPAKINDGAKEAYKYYVQKHNLAPHVAAGIVGNLYQESGLKTDAVEKGNTGNGRGIAQWDVRHRWPAFLKWAKGQDKDPYKRSTQLDYVLIEPGWGDTTMQKLIAAKDSDDATMIFGRSFERPKESLAAWEKRKTVAKTLLST